MNGLSRAKEVLGYSEETERLERFCIGLSDFTSLVYGNNSNLNESILLDIRNNLGKNTVESIEDMRTVIMMLDRQTFPTPMIIRFSTEDIKFTPINGIDSPVDRHDMSVSLPSAFSGMYEPHLLGCFNKICHTGAVVFDIGANVGFHSLILSKLAGEEGHVYAFEPNSENCRLILMASEHNHVSNITLLPIALSDQRGWAYFTSHVGSNGGFVSPQFVTLHGHGTVVPTFTLDEMSMPNVDVIKLDVEGAEYKVLKGGEALLSRSRPAIVCEFSMEMTNRVSGVEPLDFLNWIMGMDYRIFVIDRASCEVVRIDSIPTLFDNWGSPTRIEDLLFLPREKTNIIDGV